MKIVYLLVAALILNSCVTGYKKLDDVNSSLNSIVQAVEAVIPGGSRVKSQNGRIIESFYFNRFDPDKKINPETVSERTFVRVKILGTTKPYDVEVGVFVERLDDGEYILAGHDEGLGENYAKWINERLAKSRGELNAIDVFKPF